MLNIKTTGKLHGENITIKQVSKTTAKKYFAQGKEIYLQSSNMRPFNIWQSIYPVKLDNELLQADIKHNQFCINLYTEQVNKCKNSSEEWEKRMLQDAEITLNVYKSKVIDAGTQFEQIVNNYSFYNCDNERGRYIHFYIKID